MTELTPAPTDFSENWADSPKDWWRLSIGMGDAIAFSGAAVWLSRQYGHIYFPCLGENERSVKSIFADHPLIEVKEIGEMKEIWMARKTGEIEWGERLVIGQEHVKPSESKVDFYQHVYTTLGIPYSERWDSCPIQKAVRHIEQKPLPDEPYAFIHDKPENLIDYRKIREKIKIRPIYTVGKSILANCDLIKNAASVHVINSAFWWLAEHIETNGELFLHRCARKYLPIWQEYLTRKIWVIFP